MTDITENRLLGGRIRLLQPAKGYRAAIDPVLLAAATEADDGAHLADPGTGVGAAALCLLARRPDLRVTGIEADPGLADLARRNAELNGLSDRFTILTGDALTAEGRYDGILCNPPYHGVAVSDPSPVGWKAAATVADPLPWLKAAARLTRPGGRMVMIYRMDRLPELLGAAAGRFGGLTAAPLWVRAGAGAKRVILTGIKGSRAVFALHPGLILHGAGQAYTPEANRLLSDAAAFPWGGETS